MQTSAKVIDTVTKIIIIASLVYFGGHIVRALVGG